MSELPAARPVEVPSRRRTSPLLVLAAVIGGIALLTGGLVVANGDEFAKARIPPRPRLPVVSEDRGDEGVLMAPAAPAPREVRLAGALGPQPATADAFRLVSPERPRVLRLVKALGLRGELLSFSGTYVLSDGDRFFSADARRTTRFTLRSGAGGCADRPYLCPDQPVGSDGGQPTLVAPTSVSTTTTVAPAARRPVDVGSATAVAVRISGAVGGSGALRTVPEGGGWRFERTATFQGANVPGWDLVVRVSSAGIVTEAEGWLGVPLKVGTYGLTTADVALDRLRTGWPGAPDLRGAPPGVAGSFGPQPPGPGGLRGRPGSSTRGETCVARPGRGGIECSPAAPPGLVDPSAPPGLVDPSAPFDEPVEEPPLPPPPPPPVTVVGVRSGHQLIADGQAAWLVPAYVFRTDGGEELAVPAILDADVARYVHY